MLNKWATTHALVWSEVGLPAGEGLVSQPCAPRPSEATVFTPVDRGEPSACAEPIGVRGARRRSADTLYLTHRFLKGSKRSNRKPRQQCRDSLSSSKSNRERLSTVRLRRKLPQNKAVGRKSRNAPGRVRRRHEQPPRGSDGRSPPAPRKTRRVLNKGKHVLKSFPKASQARSNVRETGGPSEGPEGFPAPLGQISRDSHQGTQRTGCVTCLLRPKPLGSPCPTPIPTGDRRSQRGWRRLT